MIRTVLGCSLAVLLLLSFSKNALAACTGSSPTWTSSADASSLSTCISSSSAGDTINVAAGTFALGSVSFTGRNVIGAGSSTSGTVISSGTFNITKHASQYTRLSGFRFTDLASKQIDVAGSASSKPFIIDHSYFQSSSSNASSFIKINVNGGLLYANQFVLTPHTNADIFSIQTNDTWTEDPTIGSDDTTGERNIYIEDNTFDGFDCCGPDGDVRARLVIRYNTFTDSTIVLHSGSPADTTSGGGHRHTEFYGNKFVRISNSAPLNYWIKYRGGTGVVANNAMDRAQSPDGSTYPNKSPIEMALNCPMSLDYPQGFQVGQISATPDSTPDKPLLIFGNVAGPNSNGPGSAEFLGITGGTGGGGSCDDPQDYIQLNRDYRLTNFWSWTAYTCPHPLAGSGSCATVTTYADAGVDGYSLSGGCTPAKLLFSAQPSSAVTGATLGTITVGVYDSSDVLCTSDTSTITLAKTGGSCTGMTLNGTVSGAASSGVFTTTNVNMTVATGACTLTATASGLTSAVSSSFTISTGFLSKKISARKFRKL